MDAKTQYKTLLLQSCHRTKCVSQITILYKFAYNKASHDHLMCWTQVYENVLERIQCNRNYHFGPGSQSLVQVGIWFTRIVVTFMK
mgnify:CR=1 FL=1